MHPCVSLSTHSCSLLSLPSAPLGAPLGALAVPHYLLGWHQSLACAGVAESKACTVHIYMD